MNNNVVDSLIILADQFLGRQEFPQAIKCFKAVTSQELLPAKEAQIRLQLGRLLLDHTHNVSEAKQELQKAQIVANKLHGCLCLKSEIYGQLAQCHKLVGDVSAQKQALILGLQLWEHGQNSVERVKLCRWACHFYMRLADSCITGNDGPAAFDALAKGQALAAENQLDDLQLLFLLFHMQLHLLYWDRTAATQIITQIDELLKVLATKVAEGDAFITQAKLHFDVLQVLFSLRLGNISQLAEGSEEDKEASGIIKTLQQLLESSAGQPRAYDWLPEDGVGAVVMLLCAAVLQPSNKLRTAGMYVAKGEKLVDKQLARFGVTFPGVSEASLGAHAVWECRLYLVLKVLLLEACAHIALVQSALVDARRAVAQAASLVDAFPNLLQQLQPSIHMLLALYAQSADERSVAECHCAKARDATTDPSLKTLAASLQVISALSGDDPDAVSRGIDYLGPLYRESDGNLGYMERACSQLAAGLLHIRQGDHQNAKHKLSKALRLAHGRLSNHQLVSTILLFMAPLQLEVGDVTGANQMFTSSFTMSKSAGDLQLQVAALPVLGQIYRRQGDAEKVASNDAYMQRKLGELQQRQHEAATENSQQHEALLSWHLA